MSEINRNFFVFVLFLSVVFSEDCPCKCDILNQNLKITCDDIYRPINYIPTVNLSQPVNDISIIDQPLKNLPKNVFQNAGLSTLTYIVINRCALTSVHEEAFNNVTHLLDLDLSYNSLSILSDNVFKPIRNVQYLKLQYNQLESINDKIFSDLQELQNLDLCNNLLTSFSAKALQKNRKLKQLHLNNNKLTSLNIEVIKTIRNFHQLKVSENPWTCDCFIRNLTFFMKEKYNKNPLGPYKQELNNAKCNAPDTLKGIAWPEVTEDKLNCWLIATILEKDSRKNARIGDNVTLSCRVDTSTIPMETWSLNDDKIDTSKSKYVLSKTEIDQVRYWFNLEISNLSEEDEGTYKCHLKNNITGQSSEAKLTLHLEEKPIDIYGIIIIVGLLFCALCLVIIFMKCAIKCSIIKNTKEDQPNYQEDVKFDDVSIHSLKIEKS